MRDSGQVGVEREHYTIDIRHAGKVGCWITLPVFSFYLVPFGVLWKEELYEDLSELFMATEWAVHPWVCIGLSILIFLVGVVLHELIHGFFWAIFAKNGWNSIRFGVVKEYLSPYCHCTEPLRVRHYLIGAIMPLVLLGIVPGVISWFTGNIYLTLFGTVFTVSAIGDLLVVHLLKNFSKDTYIQDHPKEAGFYVYK